MKRILSNLTVYYTYILAMLALFAVLVYGLFGVTNTFYDIKHTGEETDGYTYVVAETLSENMYSLVESYMSDSEKVKWAESYQASEDGSYVLKADVLFSDTLKTLEETFLVPQAVAYKVLNLDASELTRILAEYGLSEKDPLSVRDCLEEEMYKDREETIRKNAWAFIRTQLEEEGVSLTDARAAFYFRILVKLLAALAMYMAGMLGAAAIIKHVKEIIFFRMDDKEIRSAQLGLIIIICLIGFGILLMAAGFMEIGRRYLVTACVWFMIPLLVMLVLVWALLTLPFLEGACSFLYRYSRLGKRFTKVRRLVFYIMPGVLLLLSFNGFSSTRNAICSYIFMSALLIATGIFYLPAVMAQAEIVQLENGT